MQAGGATVLQYENYRQNNPDFTQEVDDILTVRKLERGLPTSPHPKAAGSKKAKKEPPAKVAPVSVLRPETDEINSNQPTNRQTSEVVVSPEGEVAPKPPTKKFLGARQFLKSQNFAKISWRQSRILAEFI